MAHSDSLDPELRLETVGAYRLDAILEVDRLGQVYMGTRAGGREPCTVRVLARHLVDAPQLLERTIHEARFSNDLRHPNIIDVIEVLDEGAPRQVAIVTPFVDGPTLEQIAREGIEQPAALAMMCQVVLALHACHQAGVVHGNLTPTNVYAAEPIRPGQRTLPRAVITEFGFSHVVGQRVPGTEEVHGDLAYLAPEQPGRAMASTAADVYAVGALLYELLTGSRLFASETDKRNTSVAIGLPSMPHAAVLTDLIRRCVAPDPNDRPTLEEVRATLEPIVPDEDCATPRPTGVDEVAAHHEPSGQWCVIHIVSRPAGATIRRVGGTDIIATAPYDLVVSADLPYVELELALDGHATRRVRVRTDETERTVDLPFVVSER